MLSEWKGAKPGGYNSIFSQRTIQLHSMITNCGHEIRRVGDDYDLHGLKRGNSEFGIWQYTLAGEGLLEFEGQRFTLKSGEAMIVHIPQDHRYSLAPGAQSWEFIYVSIHGSEAMQLWRELEQLKSPIVHFDESANCVQAACEILSQYRDGKVKTPFTSSALAYKMLMALFEDMAPLASRNENWQMVRKISDFCLARLQQDLSVDDMAVAAGYSKFHFSRIFRQSCGVSPAAFLRDLRLRSAIRLLQTEALTVKEIAGKCGFEDESYFCKVFKKFHGSSPEAFRRAGKNG